MVSGSLKMHGVKVAGGIAGRRPKNAISIRSTSQQKSGLYERSEVHTCASDLLSTKRQSLSMLEFILVYIKLFGYDHVVCIL